MNKQIRVGVIGTGVMGKNHLRVIHSMPQLILTCAMDIDEVILKEACQPYSSLNLYSRYEEMLADVDAVIIASPTESHFEISRFFLDNGKHVMVEKPITPTVAEADLLIHLAEAGEVELAVGHLERFNPAVEYIQDLVKNPRFIEIQRLGQFSARSLDVDVIMDLMIHDLDIILQWDTSGIRQINASGIPIISKKIDIANVRLEFNSGMIANITASRVSQKKTRKLRIFQENMYFSVDYKKRRVKSYRLKNSEILNEIPEIEDTEPLYTLWLNFYRTISGDPNSNVTAADAKTALQLALNISNHIQNI